MWGTGNSPYPNVPAEFSDIPYERGNARRGAHQRHQRRQLPVVYHAEEAAGLRSRNTRCLDELIDGIKNAEIIMSAPTVGKSAAFGQSCDYECDVTTESELRSNTISNTIYIFGNKIGNAASDVNMQRAL